ncbi:hypothetical protein ACL7TT_03520 [Microbulbifer sp. 2304DJ12-6]|uniref:hypothetical protein n=1 Tax=Microbulbifer sp. 2304DJ12-6 TaxID=3233340 RepID=UPI0039AF9BB1
MESTLKRLVKISLLYAIFITIPVSATNNKVSDITDAYLTRNLVALNTIKAQLTSASSYEMAYMNYRLGLLLMFNDKKDDAELLLDEAESILTNQSIESSSLNYSLLASVYALKAGLNAFSGAINGKKSTDAIRKAQNIDSNNPQIWLVKGLNAHHTPKIFGGSNKKAMQFFSKAISLYSHDIDRSIYWGLEETLVWRGILHKKNKQTEEAINDLKQALRYNENFSWAKELLVKFSA